MPEDLRHYAALLDDVGELKPTGPSEPTVLELSGYPHYENVISNILAFFMDPEREHGLDILFLSGLLETIDQSFTPGDLQDVDVTREEPTSKGGRIDLVIRTETFVIGIEVKIYAGVDNDLHDYAEHIQREARESGRDSIMLLLSLRPPTDVDLAGFQRIGFKSFFESIRALAGQYFESANRRYLGFMLDLMQTLDHLEDGASMDANVVKFMDERRTDVGAFLSLVHQYKRELRSTVQSLGSLIRIPEVPESMSVRQWYWRESKDVCDDLVHDFSIESDFMIAVDAWIDPSGWSISIWPRQGTQEQFKAWVDARDISYKPSGDAGRYVIDDTSLPGTVSLNVVAEKLQEVLDRLCMEV